MKSIAPDGFVSTTMTGLRTILMEPSTGTATSFSAKIQAMSRIRRPEFLGWGVAGGLFPIVATAKAGESFFVIDFWLAVTVLYLGTSVGMMLNCLADREADAVFKSAQAEAVQALGVRNIVRQVVAVLSVEIVFFLVLVIRTRSPVLFVFGVVAASLSVQYSLPPLHLKSRGALEILTIGITTMVIPCLVIMVAGRHYISLIGIVAVSAYALVMCSLVLVGTAEDLPEDRTFGVNTTAVRFGLIRTLYFAMVLDFAGTSVLAYIGIQQHGLCAGVFVTLLAALLPLPYLTRIAMSVRKADEPRQVEVVRTYSCYLPLMMAGTSSGMVLGMFLNPGAVQIQFS